MGLLNVELAEMEAQDVFNLTIEDTPAYDSPVIGIRTRDFPIAS